MRSDNGLGSSAAAIPVTLLFAQNQVSAVLLHALRLNCTLSAVMVSTVLRATS